MGERVAELLLTTVGQFRGKPPQIPLPADIKIEELAGEAEPFFVTLPIMKVGAKSRNQTRTASGKLVNRVYGRDAAVALVEKINRERPSGSLGHPPQGQRSALPNVVQWLAATVDGDMAWAKGYVLSHRPDVREMLKVRMASNAMVATSLYGTIEGIQETGEVIGLDATNVDIVDHDEAGVSALAARPLVTNEQAEIEIQEEGDEMAETIQEILALRDQDRVEIMELKREVQEQKSKVAELEAQGQFVAEIRELFDGVENKAIVEEIRRMRKDIQEVGRRAVVAEVTALVDGYNQFKLAAAKQMALEMLGVATVDDGKVVVAESFPGSADEAKARIDAWLEKPWVQQTLKAIAVAEQGPGAIVGAKGRAGEENKLVDTPEARREARRQAGF